MEVPLFFALADVCRMLGGVGASFLRRELERGAFFPVSNGEVDNTTVRMIGGQVMVSLVGINWYLRTECAWPLAARATFFLQRRLAGAPDVVEMPVGIPARTEGELRRKVANV